MDKISIIVPCYNEDKVIDMFYEELSKALSELGTVRTEIIFVDDGSKDETLQKLKVLSERDISVRYISFSKNFGKEAAMLAGLKFSDGDYVVVMDADLQHPPKVVPKMYSIIKSTACDSVATRRVTRENEPKIRSFFAHQFYKLFNKLCKLDVVDGAMDFRMMSRKMVDAILSMPESGRFSKGIFSWVGFDTEWIEYENVERAAGETKWSFTKLLMYAIEGFTSFSHFPLYTPALMGIGLTALTALAALVTLVVDIISKTAVSGFWLLALLVLFMSGIQLMLMGVFGGYIAKIFVESKARPQYIIRDTNIATGE